MSNNDMGTSYRNNVISIAEKSIQSLKIFFELSLGTQKMFSLYN